MVKSAVFVSYQHRARGLIGRSCRFVAGLDGGAQEVRRAKRNQFFVSRCGPQWPTANFAFAFASWGK
jgi:hypothetical protein